MSFKSATALTVMLVMIAYAVFSTGCIENREIVSQENTLSSSAHKCSEVKDYGNGVLYFDCNEEYFVESMSEYIWSHNVTVTAIAPMPVYSRDNYYKGYVVVVK